MCNCTIFSLCLTSFFVRTDNDSFTVSVYNWMKLSFTKGETTVNIQVNAFGALIALIVAIVLILKKVPPAYGMMAGALAGGFLGGVNLTENN